jgi:hypothetical protein
MLAADWLKQKFDAGADAITGVNPEGRNRNKGLGYYANDFANEMRKWWSPATTLPNQIPGSAPALPSTLMQPTPQLEKHSSLVPPQAPVSITLNATMNLDGRRMAQIVQSHLVAAATFPTSAAGADSRGTWMGPSWNPTEQG